MSIAKKIEEALRIEEAPEEVEDALMRDSILKLNKEDASVEDTFEDFPSSSLRRSVADCAYEGKPVSRKKFEERNWIQDEDSDELDDIDDTRASGSEEGSEVEESAEASDDFGEEESEEQSSDGEGSEIDEGDEEEEESGSGEGSGNESGMIDQKPEDRTEKKVDTTGLNVFSQKIKDRGNDIDKGKAIKKQLGIWDNLIECRIKLQKGLNSCNRLFQKEDYSKFESSLNDEEKACVTKAYNSLTELIDSFASVQETMLMMCSDEKNLLGLKGNKKKKRSLNSLNGLEDGETEPKRKKSIGSEEYIKILQENRAKFKPYQDSVIQHWNDKVRLSSGKMSGPARFAILETSTLKQIESILCDRDRLLRRTQTNRSKFGVLGKAQPVKEEEDEDFEEDKKKEEVLDAEIFDDDDFYHKLLRDFIDSKTSDITDPTKLGRQWTKLQKLRSKMKKKVNSGATKDRKIRYTVHPKMVNFMAPNDYCSWDDRVEADLFRSLFGRASNPLPLSEDKPEEVDELQKMEQQITASQISV